MKLSNIKLNITFIDLLILMVIYLRVTHKLDQFTTNEVIGYTILMATGVPLLTIIIKFIIFVIVIKPLIILKDYINTRSSDVR